MDVVAAVLVGVVMVVGLGLTVVPFVPGLLVMWVAGVVHGAATGLDGPTWTMLAVLTALAVTGSAASLVLPHRGAAARGASTVGLVGGAVGAVLGAILLPVLGLPIGAVTGILVTERLRTGDLSSAWRSTKGALRGIGIGAVVEILAGTLMLASWAAWLLFG